MMTGVSSDPLPTRVHVYEVAPRDGLQAESAFLSTDEKVRLVDALSHTGVERIQVTSFVRPEWIPQLADAADVMARIERVEGVEYDVLIPNRRGLERALAAGADSVYLVVSASATHNRRNLNREPHETLAEYAPLVEEARAAGLPVYCAVSTAFGCPYEGLTPDAAVLDLTARLLELGIAEIGLGDTTGMANPVHVERLCTALRRRHPHARLNLHLHDTRGMALANVLAGLRAGVDTFDGSVGGLGGCPYAPGATGNVATEDLVHMLGEMGIETGIDLDALIAVARQAEAAIGRELPGRVLRAGKVSELVAP
jgi:hydroxymethylglutaryl-CoA lyase